MWRAVGGRLGVLGGSFNPIHNGHLEIAGRAQAAFGLDHVLFLPAGNPPHKRTGMADKLQRLAMVELALEGKPCFSVCDLEVRRQGVTYTVDTLRAMQALWPGAKPWYIIGADTLPELPTWRASETVLGLCSFIVCTRPGWEGEDYEACANQLRGRGADIHMLPMPGMDISSTSIRESIARGDSWARAMMPQAAWSHLQAHRLYRP
jgi:nicotinate-nucleotide adenylyltransferase